MNAHKVSLTAPQMHPASILMEVSTVNADLDTAETENIATVS